MNKLFLCLAGGMLIASSARAGEKKLMHCFAFTAVETGTQADWDAFYKATDDLPKKIKGVSHFWYGKLQRPLSAGGPARQYGVCMEMDSAEARRSYGSDPYHKTWTDAYSKVRVEGTTTFDILGQ
jgi:Stress responsive A/B Barrel Domain